VDKEREEQILNAGMKTARTQLAYRPQRGDYPRSLRTLYVWIEEKIYELYEAVCLKKTKRVLDTAGEIIITASEIAELANTKMRYEEIMSYGELTDGRKENEVVNN